MLYLFHVKDNSTFAFAMPYLVLVKGLVIDARGNRQSKIQKYEQYQNSKDKTGEETIKITATSS